MFISIFFLLKSNFWLMKMCFLENPYVNYMLNFKVGRARITKTWVTLISYDKEKPEGRSHPTVKNLQNKGPLCHGISFDINASTDRNSYNNAGKLETKSS